MGIGGLGNKRNQILKIKMQNCGAASRAVLISEFSARELPLSGSLLLIPVDTQVLAAQWPCLSPLAPS